MHKDTSAIMDPSQETVTEGIQIKIYGIYCSKNLTCFCGRVVSKIHSSTLILTCLWTSKRVLTKALNCYPTWTSLWMFSRNCNHNCTVWTGLKNGLFQFFNVLFSSSQMYVILFVTLLCHAIFTYTLYCNHHWLLAHCSKYNCEIDFRSKTLDLRLECANRNFVFVTVFP